MSALFVPFGLAPADLGGGTGLGLQVALGYAKQMGGELGSAYPASGASAAIADASAP